MSKAIGIGFIAFLAVVGLMLSGCSSGKSPESKGFTGVTHAIAVLLPTEGSKVQGTIAFTKEKNGVRVVASINGLNPGVHGFHIHEYGDCGSPDGASAGGHFNPTNMPHAGPTAEKRHEGDLGNIEADLSGAARLNAVDPHIILEGPNSIIGRGVIVHAQPDDFTTQPTGGAGARLACGVIGVTK